MFERGFTRSYMKQGLAYIQGNDENSSMFFSRLQMRTTRADAVAPGMDIERETSSVSNIPALQEKELNVGISSVVEWTKVANHCPSTSTAPLMRGIRSRQEGI
jgi:hypothetical protein